MRAIVKYSVLATFATAMILLAAALAFAQPPRVCPKAEFESSIPLVDNLARQLEELGNIPGLTEDRRQLFQSSAAYLRVSGRLLAISDWSCK